MEFVFIHTMGSIMTEQSMIASAELGKKLIADPEGFAPGCKLLATYAGRGKGMIFCVWEAPNLEALMPGCEQMHLFGWDTEVIPVEKMEVHLDKFAKALEAVKAGR